MLNSWEESIKNSAPKLDKENFIKQIIKYGYFAEQFPTCFSSDKLIEKLDNILPHVNIKRVNSEKNKTLPTTLSTYKNDISRRILSLPNPLAFLRICKLMQENWDDIQTFAESDNSLSPITYLHSYEYGERVMLNSENARESIKSKSDYIDGIKNCIVASLGYKYRLKVDISKFYNSIYTHSIAWAICGKEQVKEYLRIQNPAIKTKYELADKIDFFTRLQKNSETNGIIVGPFTSRIFSEIILAAIDKDLMNYGFFFRRYVDDYKFFFRTEVQAQESVSVIEKILNKFDLNLNTEKTEINKYPYEIILDLKNDFEAAMRVDGIFGVLNTAANFYSRGEKGAYKYALKYIKDKKPANDDFGLIISSLFNIILLEPKYGKYVISYLKKFIRQWNPEYIKDLVNRELLSSLKNELQQESLLFLQIIKDLNLELTAENLIRIINSSNDFAIVIALDIWKSRKKRVTRTKTQASQIKKAIETLSNNLQGEDYNGSHWFLLYEIKIHKLIDTKIMTTIKQDEFFNLLYNNKVTFYRSISKKLF